MQIRVPEGFFLFNESTIEHYTNLANNGAYGVTALRTREERKRMEAASRESEARFRVMADTAPVLVWMSGPDMLCTFFNRPWLEFTGRTLEQERGNGWSGGVHAQDLQACLETYVSSFNAHRPFTMEYRLRRADGAYRWLLDNGVPRYTPEGEFAGYIGSCIDITERKWAEEQRRQAELDVRRLQQELFRITRVSLMGELTSALAHELNQPLMAILSNAQAAQRLLASGKADLNEIREILVDIVADDQRAAEVIRRVRGFLKRGELARQPLDLNELIRGVERILRSDALSKEIGVTLELEVDLPEVSGDRVELQQVILNLMMNSLDAVGPVTARERKLTVRSMREEARSVRVAVQDCGPGIPPDTIDQVFEPFFTTKAEGMGLGLSICRAIIEAHQGRIRAYNNTGSGATFEFVLPVGEETKS